MPVRLSEFGPKRTSFDKRLDPDEFGAELTNKMTQTDFPPNSTFSGFVSHTFVG
jgi:hypothetical protein